MKIIKALIFNKYDEIRGFWFYLLATFLVFGLPVLLLILIFNLWVWGTTGNFEYQDFSDNYGYAKQCYETRGQLICITSDDNKIAVKSYRKLDK